MKLHSITIAIFVLCNFGINVSGYQGAPFGCGKRLVRHRPLIVDGDAAKEGDWPWHASISHYTNLNIHFKCGGTVLNSNAILTAAHCVTESGQPMISDRVWVQLGTISLINPGENGKTLKAHRLIRHPDYIDSNLKNDIAIILLGNEITFNNYIQPICLWNANKIRLSEVVGKHGTVVGFGITETNEISYSLQQAVMPVVSLTTCLDSDRSFYGQYISDNTFCAGFKNGTTVCNGDSGGSLAIEDDGVFQIRGIVSLTQARRGDKLGLCKTDEYVVFTDVAKYLPWIREHVPELPSPAILSEGAGSGAASTSNNNRESSDGESNYCYFLYNDLANARIPREDCRNRCASTPNCTHFTWNGFNGGTCWMKTNPVTQDNAYRSDDKDSICGIVENTAHINWMPGDWAHGCEFWGNSIRDVRASGGECSNLCTYTSGCTHYTWTTYNGGTCSLKRNTVSKRDAFVSNDRSTVCGIISSETFTWKGNWAVGCEFRGNDLGKVLSTSEECGGICADNSQCTHFTWSSGACWMKQYNGITKNDAVRAFDPTNVCGVIRNTVQSLTWNGNWAMGCEFRGNDLKSVQSTGEQCGGICTANSQCTHFTWSYGTCQMKKYNGITKSHAVEISDLSKVCGVVRSTAY